MLKNNAFFDDMAKLAGGMAGSFMELRKEIEALVQARIERYLSQMHLVRREEFEIVEAMAKQAREENIALGQQLAEITAKLSKLEQSKETKQPKVEANSQT